MRTVGDSACRAIIAVILIACSSPIIVFGQARQDELPDPSRPTFVFANPAPPAGTSTACKVTLAFTPDSKQIIASIVGGTSRILELAMPGEGKPRSESPRGFNINSLATSPDGNTFAIGTSKGIVRLCNLSDFSLVRELPAGQFSIFSVAFSHDGNLLAADIGDGTVQIWNAAMGNKIATLGDVTHKRSSIGQFSPDGKLLAIGRSDRPEVWEIATQKLLRQSDAMSAIASMHFTPDGKSLAWAGEQIHTWNFDGSGALETIALPGALADPPHTGPHDGPSNIAVTALSHDGKQAATLIGDGRIILWEISTRKVTRALLGKRQQNVRGGGVQGLTFSPDGKFLACGTESGSIEVYSTQ